MSIELIFKKENAEYCLDISHNSVCTFRNRFWVLKLHSMEVSASALPKYWNCAGFQAQLYCILTITMTGDYEGANTSQTCDM